ncbi:MAG: polyribonucleotide nucleotidyltransferase, partial [Planctomycetota bacterium]
MTVSREIAGRTLKLESGKIGRQAGAAVMVTYGETMVFVAATEGPGKEGQDFFPLTVDYREGTYAAGKIPGGFFKREGRPTTKEILTSRLMDRPIRPLFPRGYFNEVMVQSLVFSADGENDPDILGIIGASAALSLAGSIPFQGPIGAVRMGIVNKELVIMPTAAQVDEGELELTVAGTRDAITMVEAGASEVPEDKMLDALFQGHEVCKQIADLIDELIQKAGVKKTPYAEPPEDHELIEQIAKEYQKDLEVKNFTPGKHARANAISDMKKAAVEKFTKGTTDAAELKKKTARVKEAWEAVLERVIRNAIVSKGKRNDGRGLTDIRPITVEVGLLPRVHGSSLFTRGETQALVTCTLGTIMDEQRIDGLRDMVTRKFMLHYNFPSYSVGEAWANRGPKRREIGHGNLAERALKVVIPAFEKFPYTLRIVSDITESNGSSSMASVCGGTLAMMDAGAPIKRPVAGIAMGLVQEGDKYAILSDILGTEDHYGDMDFKVAGTQTGITALQMDIKMKGLDRTIMEKALHQAREGRIYILRQMLTALPAPRAAVSAYAPKIIQIPINPEKIGALIGPGGKVIRKIQEETKTKIEIDDQKNIVVIAGGPQSKMEECELTVRALTAEVKIGTQFRGKVVSIKDFGAFVEIFPGQEGLVHVSELADGYVERVTDVVKMGDVVDVEVIDVDPQGRIKLSKKRIDRQKKGLPAEDPNAPPRGDRGGGRGCDRGGDRGGRGGDRGGRGGDRG